MIFVISVCFYLTNLKQSSFDVVDLVVLSKYHSTWNARPKERRSQDYINWTAKLTKHAQESDTDNEEARNVLACAKYLNVSSLIVANRGKEFKIHVTLV